MDDDCQKLFESEMKVSKVFYEAKLVAEEAPSRISETRRDLSDIGRTRFLSEIQQAKLFWDKHVQFEHYPEVIHCAKKGDKNNLTHQLNLQLDSNRLLRCHGRLDNPGC